MTRRFTVYRHFPFLDLSISSSAVVAFRGRHGTNRLEFEKRVAGMSSDDIILAAIEDGYLENRNIKKGDEVNVPRWLAEILMKSGAFELVDKTQT